MEDTNFLIELLNLVQSIVSNIGVATTFLSTPLVFQSDNIIYQGIFAGLITAFPNTLGVMVYLSPLMYFSVLGFTLMIMLSFIIFIWDLLPIV